MQQASTTESELLKEENLIDVLKEIRAGFVRQGTTLNRYAKKNKIHQGNIYKAFNGEWNGKKAQELRKRLIEASTAQAITSGEVA